MVRKARRRQRHEIMMMRHAPSVVRPRASRAVAPPVEPRRAENAAPCHALPPCRLDRSRRPRPLPARTNHVRSHVCSHAVPPLCQPCAVAVPRRRCRRGNLGALAAERARAHRADALPSRSSTRGGRASSHWSPRKGLRSRGLRPPRRPASPSALPIRHAAARSRRAVPSCSGRRRRGGLRRVRRYGPPLAEWGASHREGGKGTRPFAGEAKHDRRRCCVPTSRSMTRARARCDANRQRHPRCPHGASRRR